MNTGLMLTTIREENRSADAAWILSIASMDAEVMEYWQKRTDAEGKNVYAFLENMNKK